MLAKSELEKLPKVDTCAAHHWDDFDDPKIYAKEMHLPAGAIALSHKHSYHHISILAKGKCIVEVDGERTTYNTGTLINIKAGSAHQIEAIEDVIWFCIHPTNETDVNKIDEVAIELQ